MIRYSQLIAHFDGCYGWERDLLGWSARVLDGDPGDGYEVARSMAAGGGNLVALLLAPVLLSYLCRSNQTIRAA